MSEVSELLAGQEKLGKEMKELRIKLAAKDSEILHLRLQNQKLSFKGPGPTNELAVEKATFLVKIAELIGEVQELNAQVKALPKQLLDAHNAENERMEMLLKYFPKSPTYV